MKAYVFMFAFVCEVTALEDLNVGTVLFSPSDVRKTAWSATDLGLLRARKRFQTLIPPACKINTNENFVMSILNYFKECYLAVKNSAKEKESDFIMNAALSDTIGGFLKAWVLPITKFAYYGGTISHEDATKLFDLYEEVKMCLDTDGKAWRSPDPNLLNSISINIAPLRLPNSIQTNNPCEKIAYFEKTKTGLAIPVPKVNWNEDVEAIFIPLKNQTLIPLHSPKTDSLSKYYDAVNNCLKLSKIEDQSGFENRFQNWLEIEVIPHLNDEKFYPALGNVLTLVNKSRNMVENIVEICGKKPPTVKKLPLIGYIDVSSKKIVFISVVIMMEIIWCIPTLCFLIYKKIVRRKSASDICLYVEMGKNDDDDDDHGYACTQCTPSERIIHKWKSIFKINGAKDHKDKKSTKALQTKSCVVDARCSPTTTKLSEGTGTRSFLGSHMRSSSTAKNCVCEHKVSVRRCRKCSAKLKINTDAKKSKSKCLHNESKKQSNMNETYSITTVQPNKTVTINKSTSKNTTTEIDIKIEKSRQSIILPTGKIKEVSMICKCESGKKCECQKDESEKKIKTVNVVNELTSTGFLKSQEVKRERRRGLKLTSHNPYLEITIEGDRSISMDIDRSINLQDTKVKQSKIPRRAFNSTAAQTPSTNSKKMHTLYLCTRKSFIPQPTKKTVDDINIKNEKKDESDCQKLNVTL